MQVMRTQTHNEGVSQNVLHVSISKGVHLPPEQKGGDLGAPKARRACAQRSREKPFIFLVLGIAGNASVAYLKQVKELGNVWQRSLKETYMFTNSARIT